MSNLSTNIYLKFVFSLYFVRFIQLFDNPNINIIFNLQDSDTSGPGYCLISYCKIIWL